jgi:uncharacterized membrane protein YgdD (TMEM256/DUF423 family)
MYTFRGLPALAALSLLFISVAAEAQTCSSLRAELNASGIEMAGIAIDYPMTHIAILACLANNERREDAFACAASAVALSCLGMGGDYCRDLTSRWGRAGQNYWSVIAEMRRLGCRI